MQNARAPGVGQQRPGAALPGDQNLQELFTQGESALRSGDLDGAERNFQSVLALNPKVAGAYANLGVIYMRRKQWDKALTMLGKAERLAPKVPGIRLNIGLAYYRQNDFRSAISPFESVVRDQPDSLQARHLLGLCYFFAERWADTAKMLEPLWGKESDQLNYLYVLYIAAGNAHLTALEDRALARMVEVGENSAEFHLFTGKAHLQRQEYDKAVLELQTAAQKNPALPFVHFYLGLAYLRKQDYPGAKSEFLKDVAVEPDVAYNYDELGSVYSLLQQDREAENSYQHALRLDGNLISSRLGLAKLYQRQVKFAQALAELNLAAKMDPNAYAIHYLRGQVLLRLGHTKEGREELDVATRMLNASRTERQKQLGSEPLPNPELTREPQ